MWQQQQFVVVDSIHSNDRNQNTILRLTVDGWGFVQQFTAERCKMRQNILSKRVNQFIYFVFFVLNRSELTLSGFYFVKYVQVTVISTANVCYSATLTHCSNLLTRNRFGTETSILCPKLLSKIRFQQKKRKRKTQRNANTRDCEDWRDSRANAFFYSSCLASICVDAEMVKSVHLSKLVLCIFVTKNWHNRKQLKRNSMRQSLFCRDLSVLFGGKRNRILFFFLFLSVSICRSLCWMWCTRERQVFALT